MTKRNKFVSLYESYMRRHQRGGFQVGDVFIFNKNFKSDEGYKKLGQNVKDLIDQMIDSGLHIRVVNIKDTAPQRYPASDAGSSLEVNLDLAVDTGGGRYMHYVTIPCCLGEPVTYGQNLPPIPDAMRRVDKVNIKPEEYVEDEEHPSNKSERRLAKKNTTLKYSNGAVQQNYTKNLKESINNGYMRKNDAMLLESAYNSVLLRSQLENLTIPQLQYVVENATSYELDVIEELFGGVGNLLKAGKQAVQTGARAVGQAASSAGQAVKAGAQQAGQAIQGAAQQAGQAVKGAGQAVKAGAQQVGKNVQNLYQTGEQEAAAEQRKAEVAKSITTLQQQLEALKQANPRIGQEIGEISEMTIGQIQQLVQRGLQSKQRASRGARQTGVFGGVGTAASNAYNQQQ